MNTSARTDLQPSEQLRTNEAPGLEVYRRHTHEHYAWCVSLIRPRNMKTL